MKRTIFITSLMLLLATAPAMSQMMGGNQMMGDQRGQTSQQMMGQQQTQPQPTPYQMYPGMMGGYGYGMGSQMMGGGYGYGMMPNMMGYNMGPQMMGNYGYGMNPPGMVGGGYGYGMMPNMMGYNMGPQMMSNYGYGMNPPGMMGGYGCGISPGMMGGYSYGMGPGIIGYYSPEQYEKQFKEQQDFFDTTRELRKKLHDLRFDYAEALRNPETDRKDLEKMNEEMESIWKQINAKKKSDSE